MDDLPMPLPQSISEPTSVPAAQLPAMSGNSPVSPDTADPKDLLSRASEQLDQTIAHTVLDPTQRAEEINSIKSAYLKARFNVEVGPK